MEWWNNNTLNAKEYQKEQRGNYYNRFQDIFYKKRMHFLKKEKGKKVGAHYFERNNISRICKDLKSRAWMQI